MFVVTAPAATVTTLVTSALLQVDVDIDIDPVGGLAGGAVGAFLTTLIVGAILVAVAPDYTVDRMTAVLDDPLGTLVYGIVVFFLLALLVFVLVPSIVGIFVVIPLVLLYVLWAVGSAIAFLAIADCLVDRGDDWLVPLLSPPRSTAASRSPSASPASAPFSKAGSERSSSPPDPAG